MTALVVVGQGYVGLPMALRASEVGMDVVGLDTAADLVAALNAGRSHIDDVSDDDLARGLARGYRASSDASVLGDADVIVVCVPTPLTDEGGPDLRPVVAAAGDIGRHVREGTLVVLESTTYPGTTEEVFAPLVLGDRWRVGTDVRIAFSPERIDPGNATYGVRNTPKVVGGITPACTVAAQEFYGRFVDEVVAAKGVREAEMAKLLENTFRHVNIALVNEMVRFCNELDIDLWDSIDAAATKPFGYMAFRPGPGVGGHCIPVDPAYLSHRVRAKLGYAFRMVELAEEINTAAPLYVAQRIQAALNDTGLAVRGARILLVGVTYKPDVSDLRESPAAPLADRLDSWGADLSYHDPRVPRWDRHPLDPGTALTGVEDVYAAAADADVTVLLQPHSAYDLARLSAAARLLLDTRGVVPPDAPSVLAAVTTAAQPGSRARATPGWARAWASVRFAAVAVVLVAGAFSSPAPAYFRLSWPGSVLDVASFLAAIVLVADLFARGWVRPPTPVLLLAGVSFVLGLASIGWSTNPFASQIFAVNAAQGLVLLWMMQAVLRGVSPRAVVLVIGGWVVALLVPCALLWAEVPGFLPPSTLDPESGDYISYFARLSHPWIGRSNNIAVLLALPIVPLAVWGVRHRSRTAQAFATLALVTTVMTLSRGTLLSLLVGAVLLLVLARRDAISLWRWAIGSLAASVVALLLMFWLNPASREHMASRTSATNIDARGDLLAEAVEAIRAYPWRGQGPSVTPSFHNIALQQLVDFGLVVGLLVNVLLVAVVVWWWVGPRRRETRWLAVACGVAVAAQLGSCLVEASYGGGFLRNLIWLSWGLLLALYAAETRAEPSATTVST